MNLHRVVGLAVVWLPTLTHGATSFDEPTRQRFLAALRAAVEQSDLLRSQQAAADVVSDAARNRTAYPAVNHCHPLQGESYLFAAARADVEMMMALTTPPPERVVRAKQDLAQFAQMCPADVENGTQFIRDIEAVVRPIQQQKITRHNAQVQARRDATSALAARVPGASSGASGGGPSRSSAGSSSPPSSVPVAQTVKDGVWYRCAGGEVQIFRHFVYSGPHGGRMYEQWLRPSKDHGYQAEAMYIGEFEVRRDQVRVINAEVMEPAKTWIDPKDNQYAVKWTNDWRRAAREPETISPRPVDATPNHRQGFIARTAGNKTELYCEDDDNDGAIITFLRQQEQAWTQALKRAVYETDYAPQQVAAAMADSSTARDEVLAALAQAQQSPVLQCPVIARSTYEDVQRGDQMRYYYLHYGRQMENGVRGSARDWKTVAEIYRQHLPMLKQFQCSQ